MKKLVITLTLVLLFCSLAYAQIKGSYSKPNTYIKSQDLNPDGTLSNKHRQISSRQIKKHQGYVTLKSYNDDNDEGLVSQYISDYWGIEDE